jgi:hypothetical protein
MQIMAYDQERAERVCTLIETTTKGVTRICSEHEDDPDFPGESLFYKWLNESEDLRERYARAKSGQADLLVDEMLDIADDSDRDTLVDDEGKERLNSEFVQRSRLRIDTRKWIASKLKPKKYGDRITQDHTGGISIITATAEDEQI